MTTRLIALLVTTALLGFLVGSRAVGSSAPPANTTDGAAVRDRHPLHGGFWRPAGSDAERPVLSLTPVAWTPSATSARRPQPDALASLGAVVRLASLE